MISGHSIYGNTGPSHILDEMKKSSNARSGSGRSDNLYCMLHHGKGDHTTDQCRTLKKQINEGGGSKNKTWTKKSDDYKKKQAKDLAAFIEKRVRQELNAIDMKRSGEKKRKVRITEEELNATETDLSKFNYGSDTDLNLDDLSMGSEDFAKAKEEMSDSDSD